MILMLADCSCWSGGVRLPVYAYDLTSGCPLGQFEDFVEFVLVWVGDQERLRPEGLPRGGEGPREVDRCPRGEHLGGGGDHLHRCGGMTSEHHRAAARRHDNRPTDEKGPERAKVENVQNVAPEAQAQAAGDP